MAKIAPKGKKVTGTRKKDKIVSTGKGVWKKALTVKAGAGNDLIDFRKSKYKNTIYGDAGNDIIYGGTKNDKITGGKNNDVIYTGKGTNTIYLNKGDGKDTLYHQGKKTTIQINKPNAKDKVAFQKQGDDLILTYTRKGVKLKNSEVITIKNYFNDSGKIKSDTIWLKNKKYQKLSKLIAKQGVSIKSAGNVIKGSYFSENLSGTSANETITPGAGNDTINAGGGKNTINFNKGDGSDTIISGGGEDTLVFSSENTGTISGQFVGNDMVIRTQNGQNTVTLKDYAKGDHSVKWAVVGDTTIRTDSLLEKNPITSPTSPNVYKGTTRPDYIKVNGYDDETFVDALSSDDIIEVDGHSNSYDWDTIDINAGSGNDTIILSRAAANIRLDSNSGSDIAKGVGLSYGVFYTGSGGYYNSVGYVDGAYCTSTFYTGSGGYMNTIALDVQANPNLLFRAGGLNPYILGEQKGNNLIIKLTNGETFTVENYYKNENPYQRPSSLMFYAGADSYIGSAGYGMIEEYLVTALPVITNLNAKNKTLNHSTSTTKEIVVAKDNADYTINVGNADGNEVVITGNGNHNVQVGNGDRNTVKIAGGSVEWSEDMTPITGNVKVAVGNGEENYIYIDTKGNANVTTGDGYNYIEVYNANISTIITGNGENFIDSTAKTENNITTGTDSNRINIGYTKDGVRSQDTIISNGDYDTMFIDGDASITLKGESSSKNIGVAQNARATIDGIMDVASTTIKYTNTSEYSTYYYPDMQELVVTHYYNDDIYNDDGYIESGFVTIHAMDKDGNLLGDGIRINGKAAYEESYYLDIDNYNDDYTKALIDDKLTLQIQGSGWNDYTNYKLSEIAQYVDMSKICEDEFSVENPDTLYNIGNSFFVQGTTDNDKYYYEVGMSKVTINEKGGNNDILRINTNTGSFKMFFDVSVDDDNNVTLGDDLIIASSGYSGAEFSKLFDAETRDSVRALTIKDYFKQGEHKIETIVAQYRYSGTDYTEYLNYNNLIYNGKFGSTNSIVADVVSWLGSNGYSSVSDAIADSANISDSNMTSLIGCYANNDAYYNKYWQTPQG